MTKKKIVVIDIGTHKCQEFLAMFHTNPFALFARVAAYKIFRLPSPTFKETFSMISSQKLLKQNRDRFFTILTEPNTNVLSHPLYNKADQVFCLAVGKTSKNIKLSNLYFHSVQIDLDEQGSSIFEEKKGKKSTFSLPITQVDPEYYLNFIKQNIEHKFPNIDYEIVLRMNCEGSEYDVIQGAKKIFGAQFSLVLGSLDDVLKYHGQDVYNQMEKFLEDNRIDFRVFNTILTSHAEALKVLVSKLH